MDYLINSNRKTDIGSQTCTIVMLNRSNQETLDMILQQTALWHAAIVACDGSWQTSQSSFVTRDFARTVEANGLIDGITPFVNLIIKSVRSLSYIQFNFSGNYNTLYTRYTAYINEMTGGHADKDDYIIKSVTVLE